MDNTRLRVALQKSGRLSEASFDLLKKCGLHISKSKNELFCRIEELPIDLLLVRDDDIPGFVDEGVCDFGIVGENVFTEVQLALGRPLNAEIMRPLGFSYCKLVLAVPSTRQWSGLQDLNGLKIATSYPAVMRDFLTKNKLKAEVVTMTGSVEVAARLDIADAVCDIISTGATLAANNLTAVHTLLESQALLVRHRNSKPLPPEKEATAERLITRMNGVLRAGESKYIMLNAPKAKLDEICKMIPGAKSPTIIPLQGTSEYVAVHAVCKESVFWETMEKLKAAGASAILVVPIEKMMD